ncbi:MULTISPECIES: hypothetical protein [unclassified Nocardiopsis]|uniref:hypothetical protein n=1 Tax=unclassified Nocardiopsis TaxID=2649073 RepID=UPI0033EF1F3F
MSDSEQCRPLRAGVFTLVCVSLSAIGHTVSSGHDVPVPGLLVGTAVVLAVAWALTGRRHGPGMLTAWMLWGQLALHVTFSATQEAGGGHADHTGAALVSQDPMPAWAMILMHLVMALVSAFWLHRGENALFAFLRFMALTLVPLLLVVGAVTVERTSSPARYRAADQRPPARAPYLRHSRVLRGPPHVPAA